MFLSLCVLCGVACQRRSYSTFLTLMVWLLTAQDLLLLDSGEEEEEETKEEESFSDVNSGVCLNAAGDSGTFTTSGIGEGWSLGSADIGPYPPKAPRLSKLTSSPLLHFCVWW